MASLADTTLMATAESQTKRVYNDQDLAGAHLKEKRTNSDTTVHQVDGLARGSDYPSESQRASLRRIPGNINYVILTVAFIEFAERFSYYGATVVFTNFIQQPLPEGSTTGSIKGLPGTELVPGALGKGQRAAFGITTFNSFWIYVTPIMGAILAETYWGRYKTICIAIAIAIVGHIMLIICAIPSVITNINASFGILIAAIIVMGTGTGWFKSNVSPLIAEQTPHRELTLQTLKSGEVVIVDPAMTVSRIMMYFYLLVNVGALAGQIGMVYAEQDIGFWLSYTLPTIILCLTPFVMWWGNKRYVKTPPNGSVFLDATRVIRYALRPCWSANPVTFFKNVKSNDFWERAKPSHAERTPEGKPNWMTFDDLWVSQVRRGLKACEVFILIPFYWICYNQMTGNLTSQAATMTRNGVPNDLINNLNPISLVIMIPIMDRVVYPFLRKKGINFTPVKKIALGFMFASLSMVVATITQVYIYKESACGNEASTCDTVAPINVWVQTPAYVLIGISEIFTSITGLEYAFTKAPENMRSFVTSMWLFTNAFSSALGQAFVPLSEDPLLVWNYGAFAVISFVAGILFWFLFRKLDAEEHQLNDMRRITYENHAPHSGMAPAEAGADVGYEKERY